MILECKDLTKTYMAEDKLMTAVDNVSLQADQGDFLFIHGHSGSGKTTLLSLIGGLTVPDSGNVIIDKQDNWQRSDNNLSELRNKTIGFVFQFASLIPTLTVEENIMLPLSFCGTGCGDPEYTKELLEQVGLADKADSLPGQLSGGQQRRVAIARAFINHPDIILADEPTGDLDEDTEKDIFSVFTEYNKKHTTTFLIVTHNNQLAATIPNSRIFTMRQGKLAEDAKE